MDPLTVEWTTWDVGKHAEIERWEEAADLLEEVVSQVGPPCLMEFFVKASGQSLGLGVGRELTVVTYQDSLDRPYFISQGDKGSHGTEWFCYGNERTEYLARNLAPTDQGMAALKHFVEIRTRPKNVDWERL